MKVVDHFIKPGKIILEIKKNSFNGKNFKYNFKLIGFQTLFLGLLIDFSWVS